MSNCNPSAAYYTEELGSSLYCQEWRAEQAEQDRELLAPIKAWNAKAKVRSTRRMQSYFRAHGYRASEIAEASYGSGLYTVSIPSRNLICEFTAFSSKCLSAVN